MVAPRPLEPLVLYLAATPHSASAALVAVQEERLVKGSRSSTSHPAETPRPQDGASEASATPPVSGTPEDGAPEATAAPTDDKAPEVPQFQEVQDPANASTLIEHPVYFVNTVLLDAWARYPMPQKLLLALLVASREPRHYFQGHPIKVVSAYPLERVLRSPNAAGRVAEWNIELHAFQLEFSTTRIIKGVSLTDFVVEWTDAPDREVGEDRSLAPGREASDGWEKVSNNITEYEGLISGLKAAHVSRGTNKEADDIAKRAFRHQPQEPGVFEERLFKPSAAPPAAGTASPQEELPLLRDPHRLSRSSPPPAPLSGTPARGPTSGARLLLALEPQEGCWSEEFKAYLLRGVLPEKEEEAERVARQATAEQGCKLLADIHGGDCGHHSSSRTLVGKAFRSGFYWPTALNDATELSNGQAERANAKVLRGLKARTFKKKLEACGRGWLDEFQSVLWSIRTTATKPMGRLAGDGLRAGGGTPPPSLAPFSEVPAGAAAVSWLQRLSRTLEVGDLILRWVLSKEGLHKLSPMREGLFRIARVSRRGCARLETQDGISIQNAWNIQHLRKFYP
ncbi:uncharacterized protein [Aegilops tauschii subsp. strangulata]|uniref:uncharacterized protein n=1 Tax=Aegilops tauschii subsp. strangulata TaxID=200361 RepID=UPI003CC89AB7